MPPDKSPSFSHAFAPLRVGLCCGLFTALYFLLQGHSPGAGNQSLHLVFLEHLRNPERFQGDALVSTLAAFPTWWFHFLARALPASVPFDTALLVLHVATTFATFCAVRGLAKVLWPAFPWPSLAILPLCGQTFHALAETPWMPSAFSHTSLAMALSLVALNLLLRQRWVLAFAGIGLLANVHLLTAAYTGALAAAWCLSRWRDFTGRRLLACLAACALSALPVLPLLLARHGAYDVLWLHLLELRSAHHVFPSTWWRAGDPVIGDYLVVLAWSALALAWLGPERSPGKIPLGVLAVSGALMALGWIGGEILRIPLVLRAQLFRMSLYPLVLALILVSRLAVDLWTRRANGALWLNRCAALALLAVWTVPGFSGYRLPFLIAMAWLAIFRHRLPVPHALALGAVILLAAFSDLRLHTRHLSPSPPAWPFGFSLPAPKAEDPWREIQRRTREETPADARILTPPRQNGFRIGSQRAIVGEWRDGTQQFFDPAFARDWFARMERLDPKRTQTFTEAQWIEVARETGADFIVLPRNDRLRLERVAENAAWMLCRPALPPPPPLPEPPSNALNPEDWLVQERFMLEVVEPNIRRHRTASLDLLLRDARGRPLANADVTITQTSLRFGVGSSLNHFAEPAAHSQEFRAPLVDERELARFLEIFNYSIIAYAGKWSVIEPTRGVRDTRSLDRYIDWCVQHGIRIEYHFVSGYRPPWIEAMKDDSPAVQSALLAHATDLLDRYGDRIDRWQVVNEDILLREVPPVFQLFRDRHPSARLGAGYCSRFYSEREGERRRRDLLRGLQNLKGLAASPAGLDFVAAHGHRPFGLWADPRVLYEVFDAYQAEGVRVHVTEFGVPHAGPIVGDVLGGQWTEDLQAEYLTRFYKICYSHPHVDVVNLWGFGPRNWQANIGLLDAAYEPRPAFHALRKLVREEWQTHGDYRSDRRGIVAFSGHHGDYLVRVRLPDGRTEEQGLTLAPDSPASHVLRFGL